GYANEHSIGFEQQLPGNLVLSVRYIDRRLKRITEDAAVLAPEDFQNGVFGQAYFIGNITSTLDVAINPIPHVYTVRGAIPAACLNGAGVAPFNDTEATDSNGNTVGAVCYEPTGKGGGIPGN